MTRPVFEGVFSTLGIVGFLDLVDGRNERGGGSEDAGKFVKFTDEPEFEIGGELGESGFRVVCGKGNDAGRLRSGASRKGI